MRWRAVVFDLDDTLYAERDYVMSGFRAVAECAEDLYGEPSTQIFSELSSLFESGVRNQTFNQLAREHGWPDDFVAFAVKTYRDHAPTLRCHDEVVPVLSCLRSSAKLGLVSDGWGDVQRRKLAALRIEQFFDAVVFSDDLGGREFWKPNVAPFVEVTRRLEIDPADAVYVGDNCSKDFYGARKLGMSTIRINRGVGEYAHVLPASAEWAADFEVASLVDLVALQTASKDEVR